MAPEWEKLAQDLKGQDDVVIAELDASAHQAVGQRFGVRGFPTIKLFTKADKSGKDYRGARDANSFAAFLKSNQ